MKPIITTAIAAGEEIGEEIHKDRDQFFRVEVGQRRNLGLWCCHQGESG